MDLLLVTGSGGLIGSEAVRFFSKHGFTCLGIDNNMREKFFGEDASVEWNLKRLQEEQPGYIHHSMDIRDQEGISELFHKYNKDIRGIIHAAAQPSHDFAAAQPFLDFTVNANGTLNLLEAMRTHCPEAVFIFTSTNKVYGDRPNFFPLVEKESRWEIDSSHSYHKHGIDENLSIDSCLHSLFGVSKAAADLLVQEYGRNFGLKTGIFRGGCLTGPSHSGTELHGFLSYLVKCAFTGKTYQMFGYKGKQVRDNIHSHDFINMLWHFFNNPRTGAVYNAGGGRQNSCSILEAIQTTERLSGKKIHSEYVDQNRVGDHIWWISDVRKFRSDYPDWDYQYPLEQTIQEIVENMESQLE